MKVFRQWHGVEGEWGVAFVYTNCYSRNIKFLNNLVKILKEALPEIDDSSIEFHIINNPMYKRICMVEAHSKHRPQGWEDGVVPNILD